MKKITIVHPKGDLWGDKLFRLFFDEREIPEVSSLAISDGMVHVIFRAPDGLTVHDISIENPKEYDYARSNPQRNTRSKDAKGRYSQLPGARIRDKK